MNQSDLLNFFEELAKQDQATDPAVEYLMLELEADPSSIHLLFEVYNANKENDSIKHFCLVFLARCIKKNIMKKSISFVQTASNYLSSFIFHEENLTLLTHIIQILIYVLYPNRFIPHFCLEPIFSIPIQPVALEKLFLIFHLLIPRFSKNTIEEHIDYINSLVLFPFKHPPEYQITDTMNLHHFFILVRLAFQYRAIEYFQFIDAVFPNLSLQTIISNQNIFENVIQSVKFLIEMIGLTPLFFQFFLSIIQSQGELNNGHLL